MTKSCAEQAEIIFSDDASNDQKKDILIEDYVNGTSFEFLEAVSDKYSQMQTKITLNNINAFDIVGTGGSQRNRINMSTTLALKMSKDFTITKWGNKGSNGIGGFNILEHFGIPFCNNKKDVYKQIKLHNRAFLFAPNFIPSLFKIALIRRNISHPTVFNYVAVVNHPVTNLRGSFIGVSDLNIMEKLATICVKKRKNALFVHDSIYKLDDISIAGETIAIEVINGAMKHRKFIPDDYGIEAINDFEEISGRDTIEGNANITSAILDGTATKQQLAFTKINEIVAKEFFNKILKT